MCHIKTINHSMIIQALKEEVIKAWLEILPNDLEKVIWWLLNSYNISKSREEITKLLKNV